MRIVNILSQNRRDFRADFECEGCGVHEIRSGYDDAYFHSNVVPDMKCKVCGKSAKDLGVAVTPRKPKYPEGMQL